MPVHAQMLFRRYFRWRHFTRCNCCNILRPPLETTIAVFAVAIAFLALGVAIWQGLETRHHNRVSVEPRLVSIETLSISSEGFVGLTIANKGVGPAILDPFQIYVDNKRVTGPFGGWQVALDLFCDGGNGITELCVSLDTPVSIRGIRAYVVTQDVWSAGESRRVFGVADVGDEYTEARGEAVKAALDRLIVAVCFESAYGNTGSNNSGISADLDPCNDH